MRYSQRDKDQALAQLREWLKPGDTVYTILRHVARTGMSREIGVLVKAGNGAGDFRQPNHSVAVALGMSLNKAGDGIKVSGCGMDMGFSIVYDLSAALFPKGFTCIGKDCPSNDHSNGDRDYRPHHHASGGYALKHRWL